MKTYHRGTEAQRKHRENHFFKVFSVKSLCLCASVVDVEPFFLSL